MSLQYLTEEKAQHVISMAVAARAAGERRRGQGLEPPESLALSAEELSLRDYIDALPDDERAELLAVMWLGRNDNQETSKDFPELVAYAREHLDHVGSYMETKQPLPDYLTDGLDRLKRKPR